MNKKQSKFLTAAEKHQLVVRYCELYARYAATKATQQGVTIPQDIMRTLRAEYDVCEWTVRKILQKYYADHCKNEMSQQSDALVPLQNSGITIVICF